MKLKYTKCHLPKLRLSFIILSIICLFNGSILNASAKGGKTVDLSDWYEFTGILMKTNQSNKYGVFFKNDSRGSGFEALVDEGYINRNDKFILEIRPEVQDILGVENFEKLNNKTVKIKCTGHIYVTSKKNQILILSDIKSIEANKPDVISGKNYELSGTIKKAKTHSGYHMSFNEFDKGSGYEELMDEGKFKDGYNILVGFDEELINEIGAMTMKSLANKYVTVVGNGKIRNANQGTPDEVIILKLFNLTSIKHYGEDKNLIQ